MAIMEQRKWTVYVHENKINGKMYVGITSQIPKYRWGKNGFRYSKNDNAYFYNAIKKYGWDNFNHIIIAGGLTKEEANDFERTLIKELSLTNRSYGYNIQNGGCLCGVHSDEVKEKLSKMKKGKPTGLWGSLSSVSRKVDVYSEHGDFIETIDTMTMASQKYGSDTSNISACCNGRIKTSQNYVFRYRGDKFDKFNMVKNKKGSRVAKIDLATNQIICVYDSMTLASEDSGVHKSMIVRYCNNQVSKKKLYDWKYVDEI